MTDTSKISAIIVHLGEQVTAVEPIAGGATSYVWKIHTNRGIYALKTLNGRAASTSLALDIQLRKTLSAGGAYVAAPILSSADFPNISGAAWVLDEFITGEHPERGKLHQQTCQDLGQTLAVLHNIPVTGFGIPRLTGTTIAGEQNNVFAGLATRFTDPLPTTAFPAFEISPELWRKALPYLEKIRAVIATSAGVICHSDLHDRQIIVTDNRLAALIDFGDATICDYRWDFGSLLYFHGPQVLSDTVDGYTANKTQRAVLIANAHLFSVGIAMHIGARSLLPRRGHRLKVATVHLTKTLVYLDQHQKQHQTRKESL